MTTSTVSPTSITIPYFTFVGCELVTSYPEYPVLGASARAAQWTSDVLESKGSSLNDIDVTKRTATLGLMYDFHVVWERIAFIGTPCYVRTVYSDDAVTNEDGTYSMEASIVQTSYFQIK